MLLYPTQYCNIDSDDEELPLVGALNIIFFGSDHESVSGTLISGHHQLSRGTSRQQQYETEIGTLN